MTKEIIKVGTRESALAMWQTNFVVSRLTELCPEYTFDVIPIKTKGDKILDVALAKVGDKGLFTKELEVAMLEGEIDFAVHSMKDMPTEIVEGLTISAITKRHDSRDVVISKNEIKLMDLPAGAKVGTSSLRRRAQILNFRPDLDIQDIRGNLNTRMRKMKEENFDALILAAAGVERLGWSDKITEKLDFDVCLPAVGQGAIGIETRENDERIISIVQRLNHKETDICITAERALLNELEGGCQIPIGAQGSLDGDRLTLKAIVGSLDGKVLLRESVVGHMNDAEKLGHGLAHKLEELGAKKILQEIRQGL